MSKCVLCTVLRICDGAGVIPALGGLSSGPPWGPLAVLPAGAVVVPATPWCLPAPHGR